MRKHLLIAALCLLTTTAFADNRICELSVYQPNFKRWVAEVNYSDAPKNKFDKILNSDGKKMRFNSKLDALNYVMKDGWQLVSVYHNHSGETHFFLKK